MDIIYTEEFIQDQQAIVGLYANAGWQAYTQNPAGLLKAIEGSHYVLTAKAGDQLVGLIRTVGDGVSIVYIQDILVHSDYKRLGIGTTLMKTTLEKFKQIRQKVLLTDDNLETRGFYESLGFQSCDQGKLVSFVNLPKA